MTEYVNEIVNWDTISQRYGDVIVLKDGRLMWAGGSGQGDPLLPFKANYSDDDGETWGEASMLELADGSPLLGVMDTNLLRLKSGALGLVQRSSSGEYDVGISFSKSEDEGETWTAPLRLSPEVRSVFASNDRSLVLNDGRIVVPVYGSLGPKPLSNPKRATRFGQEFSNAAAGSVRFSYVYYSDDEGETWGQSSNQAFVALDQGVGGSYSFGEPTAVELNDGRLLMMGRTGLGRFFQTFSENRGETWTNPEPTDLACYPSPCGLKRIPGTGDLLVVWNQISRWESMTGLYRHRLTCAISKDEGQTWENHKNLESLDDISYIEPDHVGMVPIGKYAQPVDRQRYHRAPGPLRFDYPSVVFKDDKVIVIYGMSVFGDRSVLADTYGVDYDELMAQLGLAPHDVGNKIRVLSTDWFYE